VTVASQARGVTGLRVTYGAADYPAAEIARGAAYELFSDYRAEGFMPNPRGDGPTAWHRYVHATDVAAVYGDLPHADQTPDTPLQAPLSRLRGWADVHRMAQMPRRHEEQTIAAIRRTARIRRGTRMIKVLSARQLAGYLHGWLPYGFCYREYDVAHLRTPAELRLLRTDNPAPGGESPVVYVLRWRAVDPYDYTIPSVATQPGLSEMSPHDRVGSPVLGTGFTPSDQHVIPEFVTTDFADLPLTANATLLAYTEDGTEVVLYTYQPEQRGWLRMVGPQWRHLLDGVPDVSPEQEYVQMDRYTQSVRLVGWRRGEEHDAIADPPSEFRVLAMTRAARFPVDGLSRRLQYATWRGARCTVMREEAAWLRLRLCQPSPERVVSLGAHCYERGVYEVWAPMQEVTDRQTVDVEYALT
jgi:hypothetical protein